jgi:PPK2 family polyphosphate:nucleotide phosphotransferase
LNRRSLDRLLARYRVTDGAGFRLHDVDPGDTGGLEESKAEATELVQRGIAELSELQEMLYAQDRWAVLLVFQAMDAAGKDGTIKHVMSGVNPQGCQVFSFKEPSREELDHDWLWRAVRALPERGRIGVFNRSYYEDVLVVRVHPRLLDASRLPPAVVGKHLWRERYEDIDSFERHLARNGTLILKFFLHLSKEEQRRRLLARLDEPNKRWKSSLADVRERRHWDAYARAYEKAIRKTSAPHAPWFVVPADHKWFTHLVVGAAIVDALRALDLRFPAVDRAKRAELRAARAALVGRARPEPADG